MARQVQNACYMLKTYEFLKETSHKDIKAQASEEINGEI